MDDVHLLFSNRQMVGIDFTMAEHFNACELEHIIISNRLVFLAVSDPVAI